MKVSAAGKLFLLGEYAVLEGGPALLTPVSQRANVTLGSGSGVISIGSETVTITMTAALKQFPLLSAVREVLDTDQLEHHALTLDTSQFYRNGQKLGLGSSAALTVALVKACRPDDTPEEVYQLADACHKHFQGGVGSGADIALAAMDTPIQFTLSEGPTPIQLPSDLHMLAIWTGQAASTTQLVGSVHDYRKAHPEKYRGHIEGLIETAKRGLKALSHQNSHQIVATIEQYDRQLENLSLDSSVNFYNQLHVEMRKKVKLPYKPSGAGGGDFGIAYSTDKNEIITLSETLEREDIYSFPLTV